MAIARARAIPPSQSWRRAHAQKDTPKIKTRNALALANLKFDAAESTTRMRLMAGTQPETGCPLACNALRLNRVAASNAPAESRVHSTCPTFAEQRLRGENNTANTGA